jgi:hypothetical protein
MQNMSIKSFAGGMFFASFLWALLWFALNFEYSVPSPTSLAPRFTLTSNPVTENRRLSDSVDNRTLLWTPGNPPVRVVEVSEIDQGKWQVVLERVY